MKGIDKQTIFFVAMVFFGWGTSVFFDKLSANKMGVKGSYIYLVSLLPSIIVLLFFLFWGYKLVNVDRMGIFWVTIASFLNIIAVFFYYLVFTKTDASWASVVTALYPILTVFLAYVFLHEAVSTYRLIGIFLAMIALIFLSI